VENWPKKLEKKMNFFKKSNKPLIQDNEDGPQYQLSMKMSRRKIYWNLLTSHFLE